MVWTKLYFYDSKERMNSILIVEFLNANNACLTWNRHDKHPVNIMSYAAIYRTVHLGALIRILANHIALILWTHISRFDVEHYYTQCNNFEGKTLVRLRTQDRHPYLALTGELCVSLVSYLEKIGREITGANCMGHKRTNSVGVHLRAAEVRICLCGSQLTVCDHD